MVINLKVVGFQIPVLWLSPPSDGDDLLRKPTTIPEERMLSRTKAMVISMKNNKVTLTFLTGETYYGRVIKFEDDVYTVTIPRKLVVSRKFIPNEVVRMLTENDDGTSTLLTLTFQKRDCFDDVGDVAYLVKKKDEKREVTRTSQRYKLNTPVNVHIVVREKLPEAKKIIGAPPKKTLTAAEEQIRIESQFEKAQRDAAARTKAEDDPLSRYYEHNFGTNKEVIKDNSLNETQLGVNERIAVYDVEAKLLDLSTEGCQFKLKRASWPKEAREGCTVKLDMPLSERNYIRLTCKTIRITEDCDELKIGGRFVFGQNTRITEQLLRKVISKLHETSVGGEDAHLKLNLDKPNMKNLHIGDHADDDDPEAEKLEKANRGVSQEE